MSAGEGSSSSSTTLEVPSILPLGPPGIPEPVAFIDEKTGEPISANNIVTFVAPPRLPPGNVKKVPVRLPNGKVVRKRKARDEGCFFGDMSCWSDCQFS